MLDIELVDFAEYLADEARKACKRYFRQHFIIEHKEDATPVTEADKEIENIIRKLIRINFPEHGVYGEEFGKEKENAEFVWVIDPIDGTKSFMTGRPLFGTLISLVQEGKPVLGLIDQPINEERWLGANGKTTFNNKQVSTRSCREISAAYFGTTSPFLFDRADQSKIDQIISQVKCALYGGDCYSYGQLAYGGLDIVIESGLKPYDYCALAPIVENAGGEITDWKGARLDMNSSGKIIACGDKALHRQLLEIL